MFINKQKTPKFGSFLDYKVISSKYFSSSSGKILLRCSCFGGSFLKWNHVFSKNIISWNQSNSLLSVNHFFGT